MNKKIVAIGGGENGRIKSDGTKMPYETGPMDQEIISLTGKKNPNFLFIGHASLKWQDSYFSTMSNIYYKMYGCACENLKSEYLIDKEKVKKMIDWADIIYVGGGNTLEMMNLWRETSLDKILVQAYNEGKVMCGVSAGANCWFKSCSSDALQIQTNDLNAPLIKVDCLNLINGLFIPHCDEANRIKHSQELTKMEEMIGIALSNCAALEIINDEYRIIKSDGTYHNIKPYGMKIYWSNGELHQSYIEETNEFRKFETLLDKNNAVLNK